jgi:hypothetical protein
MSWRPQPAMSVAQLEADDALTCKSGGRGEAL